jgi:hypothetical protein
MKAKDLIELLSRLSPDAEVQMQSVEEPEVGLVDIALIYDYNHVEIVERMED